MTMTVSTRIRHSAKHKARGQRRHDTRQGEVPKYVDQSRSHRNSTLLEPMTEGPMRQECEERRKGRGLRAMATNSAIATDGIITFGSAAQKHVEALPLAEQDRLFQATAEALAKEMGTTLAGLVVHRDESAIHAHFRTHAVRLDGLPVSKRVNTRKLQDVAAEAWSDLGITRGKPKKQRIADGEPASAHINRSVKQLHDDLPVEIEAAKAKVEAAQEKARIATERLAKAETRLEAAEGNRDRLEKRVATYERRLETAQREIERLQAAMPKPEKIPVAMTFQRRRLFGLLPDEVIKQRGLTSKRYLPEVTTKEVAKAARTIAEGNAASKLRQQDRKIEELKADLEQHANQWQTVSEKYYDGRPLDSVVIEIEAEQAAQAERQQQPPQQPNPPTTPSSNSGPQM